MEFTSDCYLTCVKYRHCFDDSLVMNFGYSSIVGTNNCYISSALGGFDNVHTSSFHASHVSACDRLISLCVIETQVGLYVYLRSRHIRANTTCNSGPSTLYFE